MGILSGLLRLFSGVLGLVFSLFGIMMLVFEVMVWIPDAERANQVLGRVWFEHDPFFSLFQSHSIQLAQVIAERKLQWPTLWNPGITTILNWPSWMALLILGISGLVLGGVFFALAGKRRS